MKRHRMTYGIFIGSLLCAHSVMGGGGDAVGRFIGRLFYGASKTEGGRDFLGGLLVIVIILVVIIGIIAFAVFLGNQMSANVKTNSNTTKELKCPKCGNPYAIGTKFCGNCGTANDHEAEEIAICICSNCRNPINLDESYCGHCGTKNPSI